MTLMIKTANGWLPIVDKQSIQSPKRSGESIVRNDVFLGWAPTPAGKLSGAFAHEHSELVREAGAAIDHGRNRTTAIALAMLKRNLIAAQQTTHQLTRHSAIAV